MLEQHVALNHLFVVGGVFNQRNCCAISRFCIYLLSSNNVKPFSRTQTCLQFFLTYVNYSQDTIPDGTNYFLREPVYFVTGINSQFGELRHVWHFKCFWLLLLVNGYQIPSPPPDRNLQPDSNFCRCHYIKSSAQDKLVSGSKILYVGEKVPRIHLPTRIT